MTDGEAVALAFGVLFLLMSGAVAAAFLLAPRRPTPNKLMRYEAGNPETGEPKAPLAMQYFGYVLMLVALEPAVAIPVVYLMLGGDPLQVALSALAGAAVALLVAWYAYAHAKDIRKWRI